MRNDTSAIVVGGTTSYVRPEVGHTPPAGWIVGSFDVGDEICLTEPFTRPIGECCRCVRRDVHHLGHRTRRPVVLETHRERSAPSLRERRHGPAHHGTFVRREVHRRFIGARCRRHAHLVDPSAWDHVPTTRPVDAHMAHRGHQVGAHRRRRSAAGGHHPPQPEEHLGRHILGVGGRPGDRSSRSPRRRGMTSVELRERLPISATALDDQYAVFLH